MICESAVRVMFCLTLLVLPWGFTGQEAAAPINKVRVPGDGECPLYPVPLGDEVVLSSPFTTQDGREIVKGRSADGKTYLLDLTRRQDEELQDGRRRVFGAGRQCSVGCDDFRTLALTGLHADEELVDVKTISGRSVAEINRMGQPGSISTAGFLGTGEDLLALLRADNETVRSLGLSHPELAEPLFHLWNLVLLEVNQRPRPTDDQRISSLYCRGKEVVIRTASSRGIQTSLFQDEIVGNSEFWIERDLTDTDRAFLRETYPDLPDLVREEMERRLTRIHTGEMVPFYISRYGFYEGHTDYRADPLALAWIFGFRTLEQIEAALPGRLPQLLALDWPD